MRVRSTILMLLAFSAPLLAAQRFDVVQDDRWPQSALVQKLVISPADFDLSFLRELVGQVLATDGQAFPVVKVEVFTDRKAAFGNFRSATDVNYSLLMALFY